MSNAVRVFVGLGIPFLAVLATIPLLSQLQTTVFGLPIEVIWLFCCIPLTSMCLAICWYAHDRHQPDEAPPSENLPP